MSPEIAFLLAACFIVLSPVSQADECQSVTDYCTASPFLIEPNEIEQGHTFNLTTRGPIQEAALFNSSYDYCALSDFSEGFYCTILYEICNGSTCSYQILCNDSQSIIGVERGPVNLTVIVSDQEHFSGDSETSRRSDDTLDAYGSCFARTEVFWNANACIVEQTLNEKDECSGITDVITANGSNGTVFIISVSGIDSVGEAVIFDTNTYFCGEETLSGNVTGAIPCNATLNDYSIFHNSTPPTSLNTSLEYVFIICEGGELQEGPAWVVFERELEEGLNNYCHNPTATEEFYSEYAKFQVQWMHPEPYDKTRAKTMETRQWHHSNRTGHAHSTEIVSTQTMSGAETWVQASVTEPPSGAEPATDPPSEDTMGCAHVTDANLDQCLTICTSQVYIDVGVVGICEMVANVSLSHTPLNDQHLDVVLSVLGALVNSSGTESLNATVEILDNTVLELQQNPQLITSDRGLAVVATFDGVLADSRRVDWMRLQGDERSSSSSVLLQSLEDMAEVIGLNVTDSLSSFSYSGENIMLMSVERVQAGDILAGTYNFPKGSTFFSSDGITRIEIPLQLLCNDLEGVDGTEDSNYIEVGCPAVISSLLVRNLPNYLDQATDRNNSMTGSLLLSTQVTGSPQLPLQITEHPIQMFFEPTYTANNISNKICVFWDFTQGDWSSSGLETRVDERGRVMCTTTHLTSFAVLVEVNGPQAATEEEAYALMIVSYIGCGVSLLCLTIAIVVFATCGKQLNKGVLLHIHANFAVALSLGLIIFIAGIESATRIPWLCTLVAALLHYFFLCVFCWMLAEGIMLYLLVVRVFGTAAEKWYYLLILGWGLPLPIVGVSVGIRLEDYGTEDFCWLSTNSGTIWAFVGPMIFIIMVNTVILVLTLCNMVKSRKYGGAEHGVRHIHLVKTALKGAVILLPLLGITWIIGIFAVNENTTVFAWLFTIFNSLQGLFIFLFHVLRNDKVWECLKCVLPVTAMDRKESLKEMSSNMTTGETCDGMEANTQDAERMIATQYRLHTQFGRTFSDTSQGSSTVNTQ